MWVVRRSGPRLWIFGNHWENIWGYWRCARVRPCCRYDSTAATLRTMASDVRRFYIHNGVGKGRVFLTAEDRRWPCCSRWVKKCVCISGLTGWVDVNVTPDKRRVFLAAEDGVVALLQQVG